MWSQRCKNLLPTIVSRSCVTNKYQGKGLGAPGSNPEEDKGTVFYRTFVLFSPFYNSGTHCSAFVTMIIYPLVNIQKAIENGPVEIVSFPINSMVVFYSYVTVYQRVSSICLVMRQRAVIFSPSINPLNDFAVQLCMFQVFKKGQKGHPKKKNTLYIYISYIPLWFHYYPTVFQEYSHHMPLDSKHWGVSQVGGSQKISARRVTPWNTANGCLGWKRISHHVRESPRCIHNIYIYPLVI